MPGYEQALTLLRKYAERFPHHLYRLGHAEPCGPLVQLFAQPFDPVSCKRPADLFQAFLLALRKQRIIAAEDLLMHGASAKHHRDAGLKIFEQLDGDLKRAVMVHPGGTECIAQLAAAHHLGKASRKTGCSLLR